MIEGVAKLRLDELCDFMNGGAWNESEYTESGMPVLKVSNFSANSFSLDSTSFLPKESSKKYKKHRLKQDDLVIATVGSHQSLVNSAAGRTIAINSKIAGYYLNQNAVLVRTKNTKLLDQKYLTFVGESGVFRNYIQVRGKGAANQMRIAIGDIKSFPIQLPALIEQQKIATILSTYDDLIENNLQRIKLLEEMAQITYEEWFVRMKFPGHETAAIDPESGLPEGWHKGKVEELFELQRGFDLPTQDRKDGDIPVLASTGIIDNHSVSKVAGPGVVTGRSGTIGEVTYIQHDYWPLNTALWVKKFHGCGPIYVFHFLKLFDLERMGGGSAVPSLDRKVVHSQFVAIPPGSLINKYEQMIAPGFDVIEMLSSQNKILKEARNILLPRLMTGMIDIEKIELPEALLARIKQAQPSTNEAAA